MKVKTMLAALAGLAGLAALTGTASAGGLVFAAAGCTPDTSTAAKTDNVPFVQHESGTTGTIRLVCPIVQPRSLGTGSSHFLRMAYRDSTGTATGASVSVAVVAGNLLTGALTEVAKISSNSFAAKTYSAKEIAFEHVFDGDTNYYFLGITLTRATTAQIVEVHAVNVE